MTADTGPTEASPGDSFGRVAEDGTVYVRTKAGERTVGQWPDGDATEALTFFRRRFDSLETEVRLLEQRIHEGHLGPADAAAALNKVRSQVAEAHAVGDLDALTDRLDALRPAIAAARERRRAERDKKLEEARDRKQAIAVEAEKLSEGQDWRAGANRLRELLDLWKALPRLDKATDDTLWRRFSTARTTYTRRRKQHFVELNEQREGSQAIKERLVSEAESLAGSTDWAATAKRYRDLMRDWKSAGRAHKDVDDKLWARFRTAQDRFFTARDAVNAELDKEFATNAEQKVSLLEQAEALLPITDARRAREVFRSIGDRWDAAGKVPRGQMKSLEARLRKVEDAIRAAEQDRWRRSNPEARARAQGTAAQLVSLIEGLERDLAAARATGDEHMIADAEEALSARRTWLTQARLTLDEFSPADPPAEPRDPVADPPTDPPTDPRAAPPDPPA
jgi:hypothetical protein